MAFKKNTLLYFIGMYFDEQSIHAGGLNNIIRIITLKHTL